jgi:hypothetical protein
MNVSPIVFGVVLSLYSLASAAEPTGREIMDKQKARHESTTEYEAIKMVLVDSSGKTESRELQRYSKNKDGLFKYLVRFNSPADIKGVSLLTWQQKDREDDQWLYLPAVGEKLKRIAGGGKKTYFMGTDFAYEDLRSEKLDDHTYNVLREEALDGKNCWVIEALPATESEKQSSGYSKRIMWVQKDTLVSLKVEYYDQTGKLMKTGTSFDIQPAKGDLMRAGKVLMDHHLNKHKTVMGTVERKINEPIDDSLFTERSVLSGGK